MKIDFKGTDRDKILSDIKEAMGDRALADMVNFALTSGSLKVTISKLGTSILEFAESAQEDSLRYTLAKEKIAFAHKAFKDEVTNKILKVVEKAGGIVSR